MAKKNKEGHPQYQTILFIDSTTGREFICGAAMSCEQTKEYQGQQYPCCHVSISSDSHPLFTGKQGLVDAEGRVKRFKRRYTEATQKHKRADEE